MPSVARALAFSALVVPLAALAACSGNNDAPAGPDAGAGKADAASDADLSCRYKDFRGNEVVCIPNGAVCPSTDGCNGTVCSNGSLMTTLILCSCSFPGVTFGGQDYMMYGTRTADDGCTVCTCGKDTGGPYLEYGGTCDSSACK